MNNTLGVLIFLAALYGIYSMMYPIHWRMREVFRSEMKNWMEDSVSRRHEQLMKLFVNRTNTIK